MDGSAVLLVAEILLTRSHRIYGTFARLGYSARLQVDSFDLDSSGPDIDSPCLGETCCDTGRCLDNRPYYLPAHQRFQSFSLPYHGSEAFRPNIHRIGSF